jgi:hypothetical protein
MLTIPWPWWNEGGSGGELPTDLGTAAYRNIGTGPNNVWLGSVIEDRINTLLQDLVNEGDNNGFVFVTDIVPTVDGNVGNKIYSADFKVLKSCSVTTDRLKVKILAASGHSNYTPNVTLDGQAIVLTETTIPSIFEGELNIILTPGQDKITLQHEDGPTTEVIILQDEKPVITGARFIGNYPTNQTELKENDSFQFSVESTIPITTIELENYGAFKAQTITSVSGNAAIRTGVVANRGTTTQALGFRVRVRSISGAWSDWYTTSDYGNTDAVHRVNLNNLYPTVTISNILYPTGQQALKNNESATIVNTITNANVVSYLSPNSQLSIADAHIYNNNKIVSRVAGSVNTSTNNLRIVATRTANGASREQSTIVFIMNIAPTITIITPAVRLRSGGNNNTQPVDHVITISSDQNLLSAPTLTAPIGNWIGSNFTGSNKVWTRSLRIHDDDPKGTYNWQGLQATNLAGITTSVITSGISYTLGGFIKRRFYVAAFPNREGSIGTYVTDTSKLRCTNLSKGAENSLNTTYQETMTNDINRFTITGPSGVLNPFGNLWYNNDGLNASSNTSGAMQIDLEEVV